MRRTPRRVTIFDTQAGNLHSLATALARSGSDVVIEQDPAPCARADMLFLPGVGAFEPVAARLEPSLDLLREAVAEGLPTVGICLGAQLLCDGSDEGAGEGLGVFPGRVTSLLSPSKPHIGWNALQDVTDPIVANVRLRDVYYAHSYACRLADPERYVTAWTTHENDRFPAVMRTGSVVGVQFHPEKSSQPGVTFLSRLMEELWQ